MRTAQHQLQERSQDRGRHWLLLPRWSETSPSRQALQTPEACCIAPACIMPAGRRLRQRAFVVTEPKSRPPLAVATQVERESEQVS